MSTGLSLGKCAYCQQQSFLRCSGCDGDFPSCRGHVAPTTSYCDIYCQNVDYNNHKKLCETLQTRKAFFRAGLIAQELFYMHRISTFDRLIVKAEKRDGVLYIHEGRPSHSISQTMGSDPVYGFPAYLFVTPQEEQAVLTHLASQDALAWCHDVVKDLLEGLTSHITEIAATMHNEAQAVQIIDASGASRTPRYTHEFLKVTLTNGENYALDLAGAEYGFHGPITTYDEYMEERVFAAYAPYYFGGCKKLLLDKTRGGENESLGDELIMFKEQAAQAMTASLSVSTLQYGLTTQQVLRCADQDFEKMKLVMLDSARNALSRYRKEMAPLGQRFTWVDGNHV